MKITLVYPEHSLNLRPHFHPGIGALAAALKEAGHEPSLVHLAGPVSEQDLVDEVGAKTPDLVGFNSTTHLFRRVREMSRWLKRRFDLPIICGGIHATLEPEEVLGEESIDMVCVGEGDRALVELCDTLEHDETRTVPGIWRKRDGALLKNPSPPPVADLDTLPFADRNLFDYAGLEESRNGGAIFMVSRGCPFSCAHCCHKTLRELSPDKSRYVRFRSVDNVIREVEEVLNAYAFVEYVLFRDANFAFDRAWLRQFSSDYSRRIGVPFMCNCRPDLIEDEVVRLLARAGCKKINIGIESGNDRIRTEVLRRSVSRTQIKSAFSRCRAAGIATQSFNMLGIPFETPSTLLDTIRLNAEVRPDVMLKSICYPYPKTELYDLCRENNLLTSREYDTFLEETVLKQPTVSAGQIVFAFHFFHPFVKLYSVIERLPPPARSTIDRIIEHAFSSPVVPHGPLARAKRRVITYIRRHLFPLLRDRLPGPYLGLRSKLENKLLVYED